MEGNFNFSKYVTGKAFIGRRPELMALKSLLIQGDNVVIYDAPKSGKMSLIRQTFLELKTVPGNFSPAIVNLLNMRSDVDFVCKLGSEILRLCAATPSEYSSIVGNLLFGTCFVFDPIQYSNKGRILSIKSEMQESDIEAIFNLAYRASQLCNKRIVVVIREFQNILKINDGEKYLRMLERCLKTLPPEEKMHASYIFSGSCTNAMHDIFGRRKFFFRLVERIQLSEIETKEIMEHVQKILLATGKVVDRDMLLGTCKLFRNNIYYINHFFAICDSLTRGYLTEYILQNALEAIIAVHEAEYRAIMNDLTTYQVSFLRAVLCGHTHFTGADIIEEFGFNSSANVKRLRDALCKKEIIFFDENDIPRLIDPLFEYWVRVNYYEMKI